ncbi:hypothetical protein AC249_AIPGENE18135, partial [Exaiptasia diaphana]
KVNRCKQIIQDCLGLHMELSADDYAFRPSEQTDWVLSALNRSALKVKIKGIQLGGDQIQVGETLTAHQPFEKEISKAVETGYTNPYWLDRPHGDLFDLDGDKNLLRAENRPDVSAMVTVEIDGKEVEFEVPATYKWRDPAYGERKRPIIATPDIAFVEGEEILIAKIGERKRIRRSVHCFDDKMEVKIQVSLPEGWKASEQEFELKFTRKHEEQIIEFEVWPEKGAKAGDIEFNCGTNCGQVNRWQEITYDHIPTQSLMKKAVITCRALDVYITEGKIAYINGVEDGIPAAIERLGFQVDRFDVSELAEVDLSPYRSVVLGIRVYNIHPELRNLDDKLFKYVAGGGNVVMQYNTASRALREMEFGPQ